MSQKKKAKAKSFDVVDFTTMKEFFKTKSKSLKDMTCVKYERNMLRDEEIKLRNKEFGMQILYKDTVCMTDA